ncbi:MAG: hypothetical protein ABOJ95_000146 [Wolbachia endosymbiont of Armadillidium vulgare]
MKNMFNKANAPYLVSSTLAIATLLASGVFAAAPYVSFLAPVAALSVGLPFIIGGAVFSALVFALSATVISKNKTISEKDAQLVQQAEEIEGKDRAISEKDTQLVQQAEEIEGKDRAISEKDTQLANQAKEIKGKNRDIFEKSKELKVTSSYLDAQSVEEKAKMQKQLDKKVEYIINSDEDAERVHKERKKRNREEVLDSKALSNLFREEGNQPKLNVVAKEVEDKATQDAKQFRDKVIYTSTIALTLAPVIASAFIAPVSMSVPTVGLSDQQTPLSQANGNSTVNLSSAHYVPIPQVVLGNKANEYEQTLNNALKSAENNFGISQNSSEPQWVKNLNKSETSEEIIDGGTLPNLFYEDSNNDYQFAKPSITHAESSKTVGSNQTAIAKYSDANTGFANYFMGTYGRFLKNLNPFGSREHPVSMLQDQVESEKTAESNKKINVPSFVKIDNGIDTSKRQGTFFNSVELSKLTAERPIQPGL